jgi:hypothetical protein
MFGKHAQALVTPCISFCRELAVDRFGHGFFSDGGNGGVLELTPSALHITNNNFANPITMPGPQVGLPSVAGTSSLYSGASPADSVASETADQRRRRLQALQAAQKLPGGGNGTSSLAQGYGAALGSA